MDYSDAEDGADYSSDDGGEEWADDASVSQQDDFEPSEPLDIDLNEDMDIDEVPDTVSTTGKRKRDAAPPAPPAEKDTGEGKKAKRQRILSKMDDTSLEDLALRLLGN